MILRPNSHWSHLKDGHWSGVSTLAAWLTYILDLLSGGDIDLVVVVEA